MRKLTHALNNSMKKKKKNVWGEQGGYHTPGWRLAGQTEDKGKLELWESSYLGRRSAESQPDSFLIPEAALGEGRLALI